ncbi:MAG TPA: hypothetical protein DDW52_25855 [Planctomycetaceae bacterium]|nr:hypothetical protein [Planctomycetaceae bacterium]
MRFGDVSNSFFSEQVHNEFEHSPSQLDDFSLLAGAVRSVSYPGSMCTSHAVVLDELQTIVPAVRITLAGYRSGCARRHIASPLKLLSKSCRAS